MRKKIEEYREEAIELCLLRGENPDREIMTKEEKHKYCNVGRYAHCNCFYRKEELWQIVARDLRDLDENMRIVLKKIGLL